ncbi:MAG: class I SAM-dependent methyltransferase [bacterium]
MSLSEESHMDNVLLSDLDKSKLEEAYNQLMRQIPIVDGQRVLTLCRGTREAAQGMVERNEKGHLYVILGSPDERENEKAAGWTQRHNLTFLYARLTELPMPDAFFDRVVIAYSPVIFQCKQAIVKEVCRVLKPGGIFYVLYFDLKEIANACYFEIRKDYYPVVRRQEMDGNVQSASQIKSRH